MPDSGLPCEHRAQSGPRSAASTWELATRDCAERWSLSSEQALLGAGLVLPSIRPCIHLCDMMPLSLCRSLIQCHLNLCHCQCPIAVLPHAMHQE